MRIAAAFLLSSLVASTLAAHPSVGIVADRSGNIFYSDLQHVWRIAPDGRRSIAVRDVHTHELAIDASGNLYGEDNQYLGGDRYRHRVWRRSPAGNIRDVIPWRDGFWREYGFVHDANGAMYWVMCPDDVCTLRRKTGSRIERFAPNVRLRPRTNWIAALGDGSVVVVEGRDLRRVTADGGITTFARNVGEGLMGMHVDAAGNLLVAAWGSRAIFRVKRDGSFATIARSAPQWGPSGVTVAPNGDLWVLEWSTKNAVRARRALTGAN